MGFDDTTDLQADLNREALRKRGAFLLCADVRAKTDAEENKGSKPQLTGDPA
jgi:hypothetical protein